VTSYDALRMHSCCEAHQGKNKKQSVHFMCWKYYLRRNVLEILSGKEKEDDSHQNNQVCTPLPYFSENKAASYDENNE
jgi:hypothetical protein